MITRFTNISKMLIYLSLIKPLFPNSLQIAIRRKIARRTRLISEDSWPIDKASVNRPLGWKGWPADRQFALVLTHDVESSCGLKKCYDLVDLEMQLGFRSCFYFVAKDYEVSDGLVQYLVRNGFEVGVHGLYHNGSLYISERSFKKQAVEIRRYLNRWDALGFRSPCMFHNLDWIHALNVEYDASTFDIDPFEPQPDGINTIFPIWIQHNYFQTGYVELPYTLPQDFTLFIVLQEKDISLWKRKLDWIAHHGGMALLVTHSDYMNFKNNMQDMKKYPMSYYKNFLTYVKTTYKGKYWHALPKEIARFYRNSLV